MDTGKLNVTKFGGDNWELVWGKAGNLAFFRLRVNTITIIEYQFGQDIMAAPDCL